MKARRLFAMIWRINAVAILVTALLACGVLAFATWQIYKEATRTRAVSNVVNIVDEQLDRSKVQLGTFQAIAGSTVLRAPLQREQEYGFSSGSKEASSVQNYLFYDPADARAYWLIPGNKGLFLATHELPEREYGKADRSVSIVVYELVDSDSTRDNRLTASDLKTVAVSNPSGSRFTRLLQGVEEVNGVSLTAEGRIILLYTESSSLKVAEVEVATHRILRNDTLPTSAAGGVR